MNLETKLLSFIDYLNIANSNTNIFFDCNQEKRSDLILGSYVVDFLMSNEVDLRIYFNSFTKSDFEYFVLRIANYATDKTIKTIISLNQYVQIEQKVKKEVLDLYCEFIKDLARLYLSKTINNDQLLLLVINHQYHLRDILSNIDELAYFPRYEKKIEQIPCFEYSAEIQLKILRINVDSILEPILDLGCGENAILVNYLRNHGFEAYGVDRSIENSSFTFRNDWFNFDFKPNTWGTIISHLSFTNHFARSHLKKNSNSLMYAQKYIEILKSLKTGGDFYYTPDLPYIEQYLENNSYQIRKNPIQTNKPSSIQSTRIRKLA